MMRAEYYVRRRAKRARRMRTGPPPAPASGPEALRPEPCASGRVRLRPSASLSGVRPPRATQCAWLPGPRGGRRVPRDHRRRYAKCIQPGSRRRAGGRGVRAVLTLPIHTLIKFDIAVDRCTFAAKAPYGLTATSSTAGPRLGRYSATVTRTSLVAAARRAAAAAACRHELRDANLTDPTSGPSSASIVCDRRFHSMIARECGPPLPTTCRVFCMHRSWVAEDRADPCIHRDLGPDS